MAEKFGNYELVRRIGVGGMAEVFEARAHGAAGFVKALVIKRILPAFNEDPDFIDLFIKEARLASGLQHANIVQIYDFNHVGSVYYIAMEHVYGQDLQRVFRAAARRELPMPVKVAVHTGAELLKGLHYAHTRTEGGKPMGLVHRDISPHNTLLSFTGEVKIADFGIAKAAALASTIRTGGIKGKLPYMSPEQISGQPIDGRSDLFSVGIVLWESLIGRRLYQGDSQAELFAKVQRAQVPHPSSLEPSISQDLEKVVMTLLAAEPEHRYQTAMEALTDLSELTHVGDSLVTGEYMERLFPEEAQRERKGETAVQAPVSGELSLPPRGGAAGEERAGEVSSAPPVMEPTPQPPVVSQVEQEPDADSPRLPGRPEPRRAWALGAMAAASFSVAAGVGWWLTDGVALSGTPRAPEEMSRLTVRTDPPGQEVRAEGLPLGSAPATARGIKDTELVLTAGEGERAATARVVLGHEPTARLELRPAQTRRAALADAGPAPADQTPAPLDLAPAPPDPPSPDSAAPARPTHPPKTRPRRRVAAKPGLLSVYVTPWAQVVVDGKVVGQTPITDLALSPGPHRVELRNDVQKRRERITIKVPAGGRAPVIRRDWDR